MVWGTADTMIHAKTQLVDLLNAYHPLDLPVEQVAELKQGSPGWHQTLVCRNCQRWNISIYTQFLTQHSQKEYGEK